MNKSDLIVAVARRVSLSKKDTGKFVDAVLDTIRDTVGNGENVQLMGFGNFEAKTSVARKGRNPRTGESIQIAAYRRVRFKAAKALKKHLNRRYKL